MNKRPILPPTHLLIALILMACLHFLLPVRRLVPALFNLFGLILLGAGFAANVWASNVFERGRTTVKPFEEPACFVTHGLYCLTRHPMYVGMVVALAGIAVLLGTLTPWLAVLVFGLSIRSFMVAEERHMERTFGQAYRDYCTRVRRWL